MYGEAGSYRTTETLSKSPVELVLEVYDGIIKNYRLAEQALKGSDREAAMPAIATVRRCLTHLYTTLDFDQGGEVATNLGQLYTYLLTQVDLIEASGNVDHIASSLSIVTNLRDGWSQLAQANASKPDTPTAGGVSLSG